MNVIIVPNRTQCNIYRTTPLELSSQGKKQSKSKHNERGEKEREREPWGSVRPPSTQKQSSRSSRSRLPVLTSRKGFFKLVSSWHIYIVERLKPCMVGKVFFFFFFQAAGRSSCGRRRLRTWTSHTRHLAMTSWSSWCRWIQSPRLGELFICG